MRVDVNPKLLWWARERARLSVGDLERRFPHLLDWESETAHPTLKQLENYAKATHTPIGYFFLSEPPVEVVPIPDLRTMANRLIERPSPDMLEMIYTCQRRQSWYREFARSEGGESLTFVGSASLADSVEATADAMRIALGLDLEERRRLATWTDALRQFIGLADALGVLVTVSGVVGNNNHRKLNPEEFRGFALSDDLAPLVFINGADTKAAQMFTLAHELAHIWLGESALSDPDRMRGHLHHAELWSNKVAAELLVPSRVFREVYRSGENLRDDLDRLARHFKVSTLVILRRMQDIGALTEQEFWRAYDSESERLRSLPRGSGGDFYLTQGARIGKRFGRALVASTLEGNTLYRDALQLLGFSKLATFREFGHSLGIE